MSPLLVLFVPFPLVAGLVLVLLLLLLLLNPPKKSSLALLVGFEAFTDAAAAGVVVEDNVLVFPVDVLDFVLAEENNDEKASLLLVVLLDQLIEMLDSLHYNLDQKLLGFVVVVVMRGCTSYSNY